MGSDVAFGRVRAKFRNCFSHWRRQEWISEAAGSKEYWSNFLGNVVANWSKDAQKERRSRSRMVKGADGGKGRRSPGRELNNTVAWLDRREMCGTFAILSPDLFTRVPPASLSPEWTWIYSERRRDRFERLAGDLVGRGFAPFLKFFTTFSSTAVRVKGHVNSTVERAIFLPPRPSSSFTRLAPNRLPFYFPELSAPLLSLASEPLASRFLPLLRPSRGAIVRKSTNFFVYCDRSPFEHPPGRFTSCLRFNAQNFENL